MSTEGDWLCGACQHLNFRRRDSCQRCTCPKGSTDVSACGIRRTEVLAGDWYCCVLSCGAHNYASRIHCYRCGAPKDGCSAHGSGMMASAAGHAYDASAIPGWKSGDWLCTRYGCGAHNYASRTECYRCNAPKEFDNQSKKP